MLKFASAIVTISMKTKKELRNEFRIMKFRAGIFGILNRTDNRIFLQSSTDLDRAFNSDVFQLKAGMHPNALLQDDWNKLSADSFDFQIIDELKYKDTATPEEINLDIKELLQMHITDLKNTGTLLY